MTWDTTNPEVMSELDDLLNSTLSGSTESDYESGISAAAGVVKTDYSQLYAFQNVVSYSMEGVLNQCARKFQIKKLEAASKEGSRRINNVTFAFGHAVGAGVAVYDQTQDMGKAILAALLAWDIDLFAEDRGRKATDDFKAKYDPKKSFAFAIYAIQKYATWYEEFGLGAYEVVDVEATVAVDLQSGEEGFSIGLGEQLQGAQPTQFHTGHADEVLRHKMTGKLRVKENKTTSFMSVHPALYANSNQTTGYSIIVSQFGETDYDVLYTIYSSTDQRWIDFDFHKSELARIEWLRGEMMQADQIRAYADANFFPKDGGSCYAYGRECEYFGSCDLNLDKQFGTKFRELPIATMALLNQVEPFKYVVTKQQIVESIRAKVQKDKT
jgi:hypothetical protein